MGTGTAAAAANTWRSSTASTSHSRWHGTEQEGSCISHVIFILAGHATVPELIVEAWQEGVIITITVVHVHRTASDSSSLLGAFLDGSGGTNY